MGARRRTPATTYNARASGPPWIDAGLERVESTTVSQGRPSECATARRGGYWQLTCAGTDSLRSQDVAQALAS